jgi:hypothetical protein
VPGVAGERGEIGDLGVETERRRAGDDGDGDLRKLPAKPRGHGEGRIGRVFRAEHDLKVRIVLPGEGGEVLEQLEVETAERLQDRDRRESAGSARRHGAREDPEGAGGGDQGGEERERREPRKDRER